MSHTPGPWVMREDGSRCIVSRAKPAPEKRRPNQMGDPDSYCDPAETVFCVNHDYDAYFGFDPDDPNTRLLLAAPDLLDACEFALLSLAFLDPENPQSVAAVQRLEEAIAKATEPVKEPA